MYNTLSIINKGLIENKKSVFILNTNKNLVISKLLYNQGVITNYQIIFNRIKVVFNLINNNKIFNKLKNYKKLNVNKYVTHKQLKRMFFLHNKYLILTTSIGIITSEFALKNKKGGCILLEFI